MDQNPEDLQGYVDPLEMAYEIQPYQQTEIDSSFLMDPTTQALLPSYPVPAQLPVHPYLPFRHEQQTSQQQLQQALRNFWHSQHQEVLQIREFKTHSLPLARIKRIMKADEDVRMIAAEAPLLFARACEMFILELTLHSWAHAEDSKRKTLVKNDIAVAIARNGTFDFLIDVVPVDKEEGGDGSAENEGLENGQIPYYYVPPQHQGFAPPGIMHPIDEGVIFLQQQDVWNQELQEQIEQPLPPPPPPPPPPFSSEL